ncbi:unnamed protein product, partial [Vitis vinifera]|uniref:Uncharacterized protein n=1 Tax=Vitis vinifera TaxID=29760 RepID=E0CU22_VITVI
MTGSAGTGGGMKHQTIVTKVTLPHEHAHGTEIPTLPQRANKNVWLRHYLKQYGIIWIVLI